MTTDEGFAIQYYSAALGCGTHCCAAFEDCVCHKAKQHNDTGPITHSI